MPVKGFVPRHRIDSTKVEMLVDITKNIFELSIFSEKM
jgi:hypothetical protein